MSNMENIDTELSDTGKQRVAEAVAIIRDLVSHGLLPIDAKPADIRRLREEKEIERAFLRDELRQVLREERRGWIKVIAYALGVLKDKD